jgi:dTDP-4-amino-4,6-dideoxygalactose transaminase
MQGQNITVINPFLPKEQLYLLDINLKSQITTGPLQKNIFPGSIEACSKTMSLPVHPSMKTRGLKRVCSALKYALNNLY